MITPLGGELARINADITNSTKNDDNAKVIIGLYKNNILLSVKVSDINFSNGTTQRVSMEQKLPDDLSGTVVRAFIWNGQNNPWINAVTHSLDSTQ